MFKLFICDLIMFFHNLKPFACINFSHAHARAHTHTHTRLHNFFQDCPVILVVLIISPS